MFQHFTYLYLTRNCGCTPPPFRNSTVAAWVYSDSRSAIVNLMALLPLPLIFWQSNTFISLFHIGKNYPFPKIIIPTYRFFPRDTYLQNRTRLSTVGKAHFLAAYWPDWVYSYIGEWKIINPHYHGKIK